MIVDHSHVLNRLRAFKEIRMKRYSTFIHRELNLFCCIEDVFSVLWHRNFKATFYTGNKTIRKKYLLFLFF